MSRTGQQLKIGEFRIAPDLNSVTGSDGAKKIEPKVMEVLLCLAERPGKVWSREELLDTVWHDVVVGEKVLTRAISQIRQVFQDNPRAPSYIQTIPKKGYRLIAGVEYIEVNTLNPPVSVKDRGRWLITALAFATLVIFSVLVWNQTRLVSATDSTSERTLSRPLTSEPGRETASRISPDGQKAVYAKLENGKWQLFLWEEETGRSRRLTEDSQVNEFGAAWSPDGSSLALLRYLESGCSILIKELEDNRETLVGPCPPGASWLWWEPSGRSLLSTRSLACGQPSHLIRIPLNGEPVQILTAPEKSWAGDLSPITTSDGRSIIFQRARDPFDSDLYLLPATGGTPTRLTHDRRRILGHTVVNDDREIIFSSDRGGAGFQLWKLRIAGGKIEPLGPGWNLKYPSSAREGTSLLYEDWKYDTTIRRYSSTGSDEGSLQDSTFWDWQPALSPDGRQMAFSSNRSGAFEIWITGLEGSEARPLTHFQGAYAGSPGWSPDGTHLIFDARPEGNSDIFLANVQSGEQRRLTRHSSSDTNPTWSLDGRSVYFASSRTGSWQIWKVDIDSGEPVQITAQGGLSARETDQGTLLVARTNGLWEVDVSTSASSRRTELVFENDEFSSQLPWQVSGEKLLFLRPSKSGQTVVVELNRRTGNRREAELKGLRLFSREQQLAIGPGGSLWISTVTETESDLVLQTGMHR